MTDTTPTEFLRNLLDLHQRGLGTGATETVLREVVTAAAKKAPPEDLVRLGDCLLGIADRLNREQLSRN